MPFAKKSYVTEMHILLRWRDGGYCVGYSPAKERLRWVHRFGLAIIQLGCMVMFGRDWKWYINCRRPDDD